MLIIYIYGNFDLASSHLVIINQLITMAFTLEWKFMISMFIGVSGTWASKAASTTLDEASMAMKYAEK